MKKIYLLLISLFIPFFSFSQIQSGISVGIKLAEYADFSKLMNETRGNSYKPQLSKLNGITVKFNDNEFSYRIQASKFEDDDYSFYNHCQTCEIIEGNYKGKEAKIGFEKNLLSGNFQPFLGTDLGYRNVTFQGRANNPKANSYLYNTDVDQNGGLIYPFIGIKGNFLKSRVTLSAETGLEVLFNYEKETRTNNLDEIISQDKYRRTRFNTKPLGALTIVYNFGYQ